MKKIVIICILSIFPAIIAFSQISQGGSPLSFSAKNISPQIERILVPAPDMEKIIMEDLEYDGFGRATRMGVIIPIGVTPENAGTWDILDNGDRLWRLHIQTEGAEAVNLYYNKFYLPPGAKLFLYTPDRSFVIGAFTEFNNHESKLMATQMLPGNEQIIELYLPANVVNQYELEISELGYNYRFTGFGKNSRDLSCMVNVKCPPADPWQDQVRGVARVQIRISTYTFLCSGSLVATTNNSCQPYFLLADHCAYYNGYATASNLNQWIFYFNYQASTCNGTTGPLTQSITGCSLKAHDTYGQTSTGSDFYLVLLNNNVPNTYQPYYNGWNRGTQAATSGAGIHHPEGVIKKFSMYNTSLANYNTHWRVIWANMPGYGHSVTAQGSSGSPLFDQNKLIVGTLTGGSSFCTTPTDPDFYGKFRNHWDMNGTTADKQLKPWLDPINANVTTKNGVNYNQCSSVSVEELQSENLKLTITPNPAQDYIQIEASSLKLPAMLYIINAHGQTIIHKQITDPSELTQISVTTLPNGMYFINMKNSEQSLNSKILIVR